MSKSHQIVGSEQQLKFLTAGKATFTVVSKRSGNRMTFKVRKAPSGDAKDRPLFVSVKDGARFFYLGSMFPRPSMKGGWAYFHGRKSTLARDSAQDRTFRWLWGRIAEGMSIEEQAEFWHEGHCCRCGMSLIDPISIQRGIGPECWKRMKVA